MPTPTPAPTSVPEPTAPPAQTTPTPDPATATPWLVQDGSDAAETAFGVASTPDGDIVVVFSTEGDLAEPNAGKRDIVVQRYSSTGEQLWERQDGGPENDSPLGVSVSPDGSIYVGGYTEGDLAGPNAGSADVWVARFEPDGTEVWWRQFGGEGWDRGFDVAAFDGGVYVTGYSASALDAATVSGGFDGFAARFSADGAMEWIRHVGTDATDWGQGAAVAADGGLYVTGYTEGDLDGANVGDKDAFVARMAPTGEVLWIRQFGSAALDWTQGVGATGDGGVVVAGSTEGDAGGPSSGGRDVLLAAFDRDGAERFVIQLGAPGQDAAFEVREIGAGFVATAGLTGDLDDSSSFGERDGALIWVDGTGAILEIERFGTPEVDELTGLAVMPEGRAAFTGYTFGSLGGDGGPTGDSDVILGWSSR